VTNKARRYIAGQDALEAWDVEQMARLGLTPQFITAPLAHGQAVGRAA
jgi:hypothetical protein